MDNFQHELPPYTYVPGQNPHPISDPAGHSYGQSEGESKGLAELLSRGRFLFDNGFYWEAHEAWEQGWILLGRKGQKADSLKGLIKLAACGVKCLEGNSAGADRHFQRAEELLRSLLNEEVNVGDLSKEVCQPLVQKMKALKDSLKANG